MLAEAEKIGFPIMIKAVSGAPRDMVGHQAGFDPPPEFRKAAEVTAIQPPCAAERQSATTNAVEANQTLEIATMNTSTGLSRTCLVRPSLSQRTALIS